MNLNEEYKVEAIRHLQGLYKARQEEYLKEEEIEKANEIMGEMMNILKAIENITAMQ